MNSQAGAQHWGRPFGQYTSSYGITATQRRATVTRNMEIDAQIAKSQIYSQVLGERSLVEHFGEFYHATEVTLPMLETVLKLALSPCHLHFFADPLLIGGCIRLMTRANPEGKQSVRALYFSPRSTKRLFVAFQLRIRVSLL